MGAEEGVGVSGAMQWTHCWVLVRGGKRDREGFSFVEPSTGQIFPTTASPYLSVDAIWNARNYFVNMQSAETVSQMSFDTLDSSAWEYVFIDPADQVAAREAAAAAAVAVAAAAEHGGGGGMDGDGGAKGGDDSGDEGAGGPGGKTKCRGMSIFQQKTNFPKGARDGRGM